MEAGADYVFDHHAENYLEEAMKITDGRGFNIVLEMLANVNLQKDLEVLAMFGRVVVVGNRGSLDFNPRAVMSKDAVVYGVSLFNAAAGKMAEIHNAIGRGLRDGHLKPIIGKTFPLADAAKAHRQVLEGNSLGKTVLVL
jgi:NADPH2:quinone reductase